jgi:hypothetical protein
MGLLIQIRFHGNIETQIAPFSLASKPSPYPIISYFAFMVLRRKWSSGPYVAMYGFQS